MLMKFLIQTLFLKRPNTQAVNIHIYWTYLFMCSNLKLHAVNAPVFFTDQNFGYSPASLLPSGIANCYQPKRFYSGLRFDWYSRLVPALKRGKISGSSRCCKLCQRCRKQMCPTTNLKKASYQQLIFKFLTAQQIREVYAGAFAGARITSCLDVSLI
uniref:Uncharacterized protein n=1 Tax=Schistocephalus solidus TaxID=70667 RepID=A0A0X3P1D8_SCHSO